MINSIEYLSIENSNVKESLENFIVLDQLHVKINKLNTEMEQLIQDLVMANAGHVTSTLFSIPQLLNITLQKKNMNGIFNLSLSQTTLLFIIPYLLYS